MCFFLHSRFKFHGHIVTCDSIIGIWISWKIGIDTHVPVPLSVITDNSLNLSASGALLKRISLLDSIDLIKGPGAEKTRSESRFTPAHFIFHDGTISTMRATGLDPD